MVEVHRLLVFIWINGEQFLEKKYGQVKRSSLDKKIYR